MTPEVLEKFLSIKEGPCQTIFGWRYLNHKLEDYVAISNLRLEMVRKLPDKVLYTLAAPVMEVSHGKADIRYYDSDLVLVTKGKRANIILRSCYLKEGDEAVPAPNCSTVEVTEDSPEQYIEKVVDTFTRPVFPGLDMRIPDYYRCSKDPSRLRLNFSASLRQALGLPANVSAEDLKESFMENLHNVASATSEGWVVPFEWVYAGGMVVVPAFNMGKRRPKLLYVRTNQFVENYIKANQWKIQCS